MSVDATKEQFEHIELFGKPALFTDARVDVSTLPLGFYCYNLRGSDNDPVWNSFAGNIRLTLSPVLPYNLLLIVRQVFFMRRTRT